MSATSAHVRLSTLMSYWSGSDAIRFAGVSRISPLAARAPEASARRKGEGYGDRCRRYAGSGDPRHAAIRKVLVLILKRGPIGPLFLSVSPERLGWFRPMIEISRPLIPRPMYFLSPLDASASRDSVPRIPCPGPFNAFTSGRSVERRLLYEGRGRRAIDVEICRRGQNRRARRA